MSKMNKFHDGKAKGKLFDEDSEEEENGKEGFTINEDYASRYERWRSKEELQKLKDRYGENADEDDYDDSSSSDDSGDETPPDVFGKDFLRTLSCLKSKDPKVYDKDYKFFDEESEEKDTKKVGDKKKSQKSMFLKDYERETLLKFNGLPDEERENWELKRKLESKASVYEEEQKKLKESFKKTFDSDSEDGELFTRRVKTNEELKTENEGYVEWLKGQIDEVEDEEKTKDMKHLRDYWNDPKLEEDEAFLRNYILEKKYLNEKERNPTYDEITEEPEEEEEEEEEQEEFNEVQEIFEHKYNFRFEEPDQEFIKKYPRTMKESMRQKDTKRKDKRLEIRDRKKREKEQKKQDLKRLKALKRKEIMEKISKIKEITGNTKVAFEDMDLKGDFNPDDYDAKMQAVFGEQYYEVGEGEDAEKPEFPPLEEEEDQAEYEEDEFNNWDEWAPTQGEPDCEDPDFNMDCDYDPQVASTSSGVSTKRMSRKEKKRQSKLYKALNKKKPIFNPDEKTFEEYFDEYYKLDYEDIIDDLPCRFKYRKVIPNDFGLDVEEILAADDKELNQWSSLKKTCQVRTEDEEKYDVKAYARKGKDWVKKKRILKSVYPDEEEVPEQQTEAPKENKKKKKADESVYPDEEDKILEQQTETPDENKKKKKKADKKVEEVEVTEPKVETPNSEENISKKKRKKKKKKKQPADGTETTDGVKSTEKTHQTESAVNNGRKRKSSQKWPQNATRKRAAVAGEELTDSRIKAFGWNPKKFRNRLKYAPQ